MVKQQERKATSSILQHQPFSRKYSVFEHMRSHPISGWDPAGCYWKSHCKQLRESLKAVCSVLLKEALLLHSLAPCDNPLRSVWVLHDHCSDNASAPDHS